MQTGLYNEDVEALQRRIKIAGPMVEKNARIITPDDEQSEVMLHISSNTSIKKFIPVIGNRQAKSEDRTTPRVCVANTVLGCILGYVALNHDMEELPEPQSGYKGGWRIYGFNYQACLKPNKNLVFDADRSNEHWLVTYSEDTREFIPFEAGTFFWTQNTLESRSDKYPVRTVVLLFEIKADEGIWFSKNLKMEKGYWRLEGPGDFTLKSSKNTEGMVKSWLDDKRYTLTRIGKDEYISSKKVSAGLLSYEGYSNPPKFMNWKAK